MSEKKEPTDNLYAFKEYVNYTTSGVVSVTEKITANLGKEIDAIEEGHAINPKTNRNSREIILHFY